jgi:hypothetical protein
MVRGTTPSVARTAAGVYLSLIADAQVVRASMRVVEVVVK